MKSWQKQKYSISSTALYLAIPFFILIASLLQIWPLQALGMHSVYLTYYLIVVFASGLGGFTAGMVTMVLSCFTILVWPWLPFVHHLFFNSAIDWIGLVFFIVNCLFISGLISGMHRANARSNTLLEAIPDALIISNQHGDITYANAMVEHMFGYTPSELIGKKIEFLMPERYTLQHKKHRQNYVKNPCRRPMGRGLELYGKHKEGHEFPVEISLSPVDMKDGLLVLSVVRDTTERKKIEDARGVLSALVENADEAIIGKHLSGTIFSWNKAAELLYGYTNKEMMGASIQTLFPKENKHEFERMIKKIMRGEHIKNKETTWIHKDGHTIPVSVTISPIKNASGQIIGASTTAHDISQQKQFEEKLRHLAEHDPLTGLINRPLFEDRLLLAIAESKRQQCMCSVYFLDLDNFKTINDRYGHSVGNSLLYSATERIQECIRDMDSLGRLGGDEFALILQNIKKEHDLVKVAKHLIQQFSMPFIIGRQSIKITLSIGIAVYPNDGEKLLIEKADAAMYYVKQHGRNNFKFFEPTLRFPQTTKTVR